MPASTTFENLLLQHILQNANIANIGDATGLRGSTTTGSLYISLHTADPNAGNQSTNEATYTGYARQALVRTSGAWTIVSNLGENATLVSFPVCTAGSNTITHFGIGVAVSGVTDLLISGTVSPNLAVGVGVTPQFAVNALTVTVS